MLNNPEKSSVKEVAIIEVYSHHIFAQTIAHCLLQEGYLVNLYVTDIIDRQGLGKIIDHGNPNLNYVVSKSGESDISFLRRIKPEIDLKDLLIINSVQGYRILFFYLIKFKVPTIAAAGRISEFFGSTYKLFGFSSIRNLLHHNFTKFFLPRILKRFVGLIVHTDQAKELCLKHEYKKPIHIMPYALYIGSEKNIGDDGLNILVTGSISERSRDYESLLNTFEFLWSKGKSNLNLTVLTFPKGVYGQKILQTMKDLKSKNFPITYFESWIDEEVFFDHSSKAHCIIAPIKKGYYGQGELTSVHVEAIRVGLPAIYPYWYNPDPGIVSSSIHYNDFDDLTQILSNLSDEPSSVKKLIDAAEENSEHYRLETVAKSLDKFLNLNLSS